MSSIVVAGNTSGSVTLAAPDVAGTTTLTLPATSATIATDINGTLYPLKSGTAVASTSGTSIDFTGIPSWVKRITVMFSGISTNGTSLLLVQLGSGAAQTTGYITYATYQGGFTQTAGTSSTAGFLLDATQATATVRSGHALLTLLGSNIWVGSICNGSNSGGGIYSSAGGGNVTISGTLDRIRITTVNGTDTFDAGSINILYE